jgi:putative ATP-binding cassette transporter
MTAPQPTERDGVTLRDAAALLLPYWREGAQRGRAIRLALGLASVIVLQVLVQIQLNLWSRDFFNAVEARQGWVVLRLFGLFVFLMIAFMALAAWQIRLRMVWQGDWRRWLTRRLIDRWLAGDAHYRLRFVDGENDNPDYRISEDARVVTEAAVDFAAGLLNAALILAAFLGVLWTLSGPISVPVPGGTIDIPGYLVFAAIAYAGLGSVLTYLIGRPLIRINEQRREREGDFRSELVRVRDNAEGVAFARGREAERGRLDGALDHVIGVWQTMTSRTFRLTWATSGYAAAAPVVPLLVAAPQFLSGAMSLGGWMQASWAFVQVQTALGWFVDNFTRVSDWRASLNRILSLQHTVDRLAEGPEAGADVIELRQSADGVLRLHDVHVSEPSGAVIIDHATAEVRPGEKILVVGGTGVGKGALMRAIAGLWPWGKGAIEMPQNTTMMFVSERPYLPPGRLRDALAYPAPAEEFPLDRVVAALQRCRLEEYVARLDEDARWNEALPEGIMEQMGFARILLHRPAWIFLDEATSSLDDETQAAVLSGLRSELPNSAVLTFSARSGLEAFHDWTLTLTKSEEGVQLVGWLPRRGPARSPQPGMLRQFLARLRGKRAPAHAEPPIDAG